MDAPFRYEWIGKIKIQIFCRLERPSTDIGA
ncbi:uncharacterized protein METZ01_LOCUS128056 [marine metagenome]|uniref:Uncharacterized protein n=1 Tax=marine metagenome TaxID=408172 RepID=A0A381YF21_9ZZZZ